MYYVVKCKLRPNKKQTLYFEKNIGCCRFVFNYCLQYCIDHYSRNKDLPKERQEKRPGAYDLNGLLPALKKTHPWLSEVDSQALKFSASQVDVAFKNFFRRVKRGESPGFPRFKSKYKSRPSFTLTQGQLIRHTENSITLPKIGTVKLDHTNFNPPTDTDAMIKRCTISRSAAGNFYISVLFADDLEEPEIHHSESQTITALDLGLKRLFRVDDAHGKRWNIDSPLFFRDQMKTLKREQRRLARKTVRSARWIKQKKKVARLHEKISNTRRYFFHLLANDLINSSDAIALEDLDIAGMIKKNTEEHSGIKRKRINRAFYDQAISELINIISYKTRRLGKPLYLIDTLASPNKLCSHCLHINDHVNLNSTNWQCEQCESEHSRSDNCLVNLKRMAEEMARDIMRDNQEKNAGGINQGDIPY